MRYLSVIRKKSPTERNKTDTCPLTDSKRVHVIDPTISLLSDFLRIAVIAALHGRLTERTRRAHEALTALWKTQQRCHSVPTARPLCKRKAATLSWICSKWSPRHHILSYGILATCRFGRCWSAERTLLWCDRHFTPCLLSASLMTDGNGVLIGCSRVQSGRGTHL